MAIQQTVLITGGNRGLGLECCRQLLALDHRVLLTARLLDDAVRAAHELGGAPGSIEPLELNVIDRGGIARCADALRATGTRIDALINNAGVYPREFNLAVVEQTLAVNLYGAIDVTDGLEASLSTHANVVMVSSGLGTLSNIAPALARRFAADDLTRDQLMALVAEFVASVRSGTHEQLGWTASAYSVSKIALNAATRVMARANPGQRINAVSPGWARTRMGGAGAPRTATQGASSIAWAATLRPDGPTGGFFEDGRAVEF